MRVNIQGIIRRRILVNYRVDPEIMARQLPVPFRPKLHRGYAVAGICLIRLEQIRPKPVPGILGLTSENAAHRVAVEWGEASNLMDGVFIPRRDSNSRINRLAGGRLFPGQHHESRFNVTDTGSHVEVRMASRDGVVKIELAADATSGLPPSSVFASLQEASSFFERGSLGYSPTRDPNCFDGLVLVAKAWKVSPLLVQKVSSSYFENRTFFPPGTAEFDHALIMRNLDHQWLIAPDFCDT